MNTELQPLEWTPADLDPDVVALIRENYPRKKAKNDNPNAAIEEAIRQELEEAA